MTATMEGASWRSRGMKEGRRIKPIKEGRRIRPLEEQPKIYNQIHGKKTAKDSF